MTYATTDDVAALWAKTLDAAETLMVQRRLEQVERLIRKRIPDLEARVSDPDYLADVVQVEADAVLRAVRNADGLYGETDGNYSVQYQRMDGETLGKVQILPEEWETLGVRQSRVSVLVPSFGTYGGPL
ncbi:Phage protein Gp19/Gp15/Gp42 [Mycolicibacterium fortuitum]|uniref:Phage protein Gp19/Gp15/Gp42 n=1 Tax=Mycolicibacterium fortuitum TaxID=1766 RepID=A0A378V352_MYCFO|nr:Phage protein Gp19/Gp15/Gp42 [Mycolicibacterium fortuitum]